MDCNRIFLPILSNRHSRDGQSASHAPTCSLSTVSLKMTEDVITITYDINRPVPLEEFVQSLQGLHSLHDGKGVDLCVKEIRRGSYIFEMINQVPDSLAAVMPAMLESTKTMAEFSKNIKTILDFFKTGKKPEERKISRSEAVAAEKLMAPLTLETDSSLKFEDCNIENLNIYNYTDAHAIQNASRQYQSELDRVSGDIKEKVSLQWKNLADKEDAGNKAVIPSVSERTVATRFGSPMIYSKMVQQAAHPFKNLWEVDAHVEWHGEIPKRYTIIDVVEDLGEI